MEPGRNRKSEQSHFPPDLLVPLSFISPNTCSPLAFSHTPQACHCCLPAWSALPTDLLLTSEVISEKAFSSFLATVSPHLIILCPMPYFICSILPLPKIVLVINVNIYWLSPWSHPSNTMWASWTQILYLQWLAQWLVRSRDAQFMWAPSANPSSLVLNDC